MYKYQSHFESESMIELNLNVLFNLIYTVQCISNKLKIVFLSLLMTVRRYLLS